MAATSIESFIARWSTASASERSNSQSFLAELCDILGVDRPHNHFNHGYAFEFPVIEHQLDGTTSERRIDLYKRACFVLESKQFQAPQPKLTPVEVAALAAGALAPRKRSAPTRGTDQWDDAMTRARGQAESYIRALPAHEPNPPFLIVTDVGECFEIYADFTQAGKAYLPFPDPRQFRIRLADLREEKTRERLRLIWTDPLALDPSRHSAEVTREIAGHLAELAKSLEADRHDPHTVAEFLSRCLFCMFAEDVGLLPDRAFTELLKSVEDDGTGFQPLLQKLFQEMNTGTGYSTILRKKLLKFNGGLFADDTVLPLNRAQLYLLRLAAAQNWRNVEPAIFGTLLERALNPHDRHKLGAHYTPRAYVERLVLPTVIEPLRAEWASVRAAALTHARKGKVKEAQQEIREFHGKLCQVKVLDPACGSGNFLYVTLEHMKRLEGEILLELANYGDTGLMFDLHHATVDPHQFLGIEINPRAASITELVLWIGYLQWHFRTYGNKMPPEPILKKFRNIECRDAVLAWDGEPEPKRDEHGNIITVWDRRSYKKDLVTGREIPDESKRIPLLTYKNPRPAEWPETDYVIGNPPFLGKSKLREATGDGYAETLRRTYPLVPESADFVLFWWHKASELARCDKIRRFGLITTNSLRQTFNRRVIQHHLRAEPPLGLIYAVPDHPWVDTEEGAGVRIAMTVGCKGRHTGELNEVVDETPLEDGSAKITFVTRQGRITSDLRIGADVSSVVALAANDGLTSMGMMLAGSGFLVEESEALALLKGLPVRQRVLLQIRNGRDLVDEARRSYVVDFCGLTADEARTNYPELFQIILTRVKPERDRNRDSGFRKSWWLFGRTRPEFRAMTNGFMRYVTTGETAKHRIFQFLDNSVLPDHSIIAFGLDDAFSLGVLSSRIHVVFALASGGTLEDRPRYNKSRCFDPFPFPDCTEPQRERIRKIAEELDAHRKRVQAQHSGLTLTGMYNVLEKLRANDAIGQVPSPGGSAVGRVSAPGASGTRSVAPAALTAKEKEIHDKGLVSILKQLHDDLDAAVFDAYGWPPTLTDAEILERLVALNAERAREESQGKIRWLRPDYQIPLFAKKGGARLLPSRDLIPADAIDQQPRQKKIKEPKQKLKKQPWPKSLAERAKAVETALHTANAPITAEALAKQFLRAKPADITEILETLCTLGHAKRGKEKKTYTY